MILSIDTSQSQNVIVSLISKSKSVTVRKPNQSGSQALLPAIQEVIRKQNASLKDISEISIKLGPGSYTGLRVGASVANTLGYALKLKINGKPKGKFATPIYQ